jgi:excisionase family DNA binding protein
MVAVLSEDQIRALLTEAAELGATKALERAAGATAPAPPPDPDERIDTREAARVAGRSVETICDWIKKGLPAVRAAGGGQYMIKRRDLDVWRSVPARRRLTVAR